MSKVANLREQRQRKLETYLRRLSRSRKSGIVTAEDVHTWLKKNKIGSTNVRKTLSYINSTLRRPQFQPVGYVKNSRPPAKDRVIRAWMATSK